MATTRRPRAPRHRARRRRASDRGAGIVEFAIVFPLLFALLLGIVTAGLAYNSDIQLTHTTREAARFGATIPQDEQFVSGTWASNVRDLAVDRSAGELEDADICVALVKGATPVAVTATHTTEAGTDPCFDDSAGGDDGLRVQVSSTTEATIETGFWSTDVTLEATASAKHETAPV